MVTDIEDKLIARAQEDGERAECVREFLRSLPRWYRWAVVVLLRIGGRR